MFEAGELVLSGLVVFFASVFLAITGFGFGLICNAALFIFFDPRQMVVLLTLPALLAVYASLVQVRQSVPWRSVSGYAMWALLGLPLGVAGLQYFPPRVLKGLMAVMLLYTLWGRRYLRALRFLQWAPLSGMLGGICAGVLGASGPAVLSWVYAQDKTYTVSRASTLAIFAILGTARVAAYWLRGMFDNAELVLLSLCAVPILGAGVWVGGKIARRTSERAGRRLAYGAIFVLALMMVKGALF